MILTKLNQIKPNTGEGVCGGRLITGVCRRWTVGGLWAVVAGESGAEASALQTLARWRDATPMGAIGNLESEI
jgi:hypothetical protein